MKLEYFLGLFATLLGLTWYTPFFFLPNSENYIIPKTILLISSLLLFGFAMVMFFIFGDDNYNKGCSKNVG